MSATPAVLRLMAIVGDPTNNGTLAPPESVEIPWTDWMEFLNASVPVAEIPAGEEAEFLAEENPQ